MSDPFSIATGAVGLVGLALSLTKSLHGFATSVKTSSETLLQIRVNTDILSQMLSDLGPVFDDESVGLREKQTIEKCINSCTNNFKRIEKIVRPFVEQPEDVQTGSLLPAAPGESATEEEVTDRGLGNQSSERGLVETKGKFRMKLRRIGWPFREKETKELLDIIDRTIQHIGLALDTVQSKTSLKVLSLAEYQKEALEKTSGLVQTIESRTIEIETVVRTNSDDLRELKSHSQSSSNAIEGRLKNLETAQKHRELETQKLLLQLLEKFEISGSPDRVGNDEVSHAVDPLARLIMERTINQNYTTKHAVTKRSQRIIDDPPPAYSLRDTSKHDPEDAYVTTARDWSWDTPFGRISVFTTHHQRDENKSGKMETKDKSASRYKMLFTPAPWLYSKAAAFAFIKRVDGFGIQCNTPAIFKSDEPALKYLRRGEFDRMRNAIAENGFLLNAVHEYTGRTLLAEAVRCRRADACQYLLDLGADPETEDHRGSTLFNLLFNLNVKPYQVRSCLKIFSLLLNTRADLFRGKATVMHSAVTTQYVNLDTETTLKVLSTVYKSVSGLTSIDEPDMTGSSPLVSACTYGHDNPVVIDFLIRKGASQKSSYIPKKHLPKLDSDVYYSPAYTSPVFYATARAGYIASMRRLFESGLLGDPNIRSDYGRTILHNNIRRSVKYNTPRKSSNTKVSKFEEKQKLWEENFLYLVARGADINAVDPHGWTPLHCATLGPFCDPEMLRVLVDAGVDVNAQDRNGATAWQLAVKYGRVKLKAWRWFAIEMFDKGYLKEEDLKGHLARHSYMRARLKKDVKDDEDDEIISQDLPVDKLPDDDEWMFMNSMHPFESEQIFGEDKKLDPTVTGTKYMFPIEEFWLKEDTDGMKRRRNAGGTTQEDSTLVTEPQDTEEEETRTWLGTVGNILGAFVG